VSGLFVGGFRELETTLADDVRSAQADDALRPVIVLVGSSNQRLRLTLTLGRHLGALANVEILTINRFAQRVARSAGQGEPLGRLGKERLVKRLLSERRGRPWYFAPVEHMPGLASALVRTIDDLREALIDPRSAWAAGAVSHAGKAADLTRLYADYCAAFDGAGLTDEAAVYSAAAVAVAGGAFAPAAHFCIFGIYDLPAMQAGLMRALVATGTATVFVPAPASGAAYGDAALDQLTGLGLDRRQLDRCADDSLLAAVRGGVFAPHPPAVAVRDESLRCLSVIDEGGELREVARAVVSAVDDGVALHEIAVLVPRGESVAVVAEKLVAVGVRVACRLPDASRETHAVLRLLDCFIPVAGPRFSRRAVLDFLAIAPLRRESATATAAALWHDEARRGAIVGGIDEWRERLARRSYYHERRSAELRAGEGRDDEGDVESAARHDCSLLAVRELLALVDELHAAVGAVPAAARWSELAAAFVATYRCLCVDGPDGILAEITALGSLDAIDEVVDRESFAAAVRELCAQRRIPCGRVGVDGVAILTPMELRGLEFRVLLITALAEGGLAARPRQDALLLDDERAAVAARHGWRLPLKSEREDEARYLFALALEAARERVVLLSPRLDGATGRPRLPSRLLLRVCEAVAGRPVGLSELAEPTAFDGVWRRVGGGVAAHPPNAAPVAIDEREYDLAVLLARVGETRVRAREYLATVVGPGAVQRRWDCRAALFSRRLTAWDGRLVTAAALAELRRRDPFAAAVSPSALQRYIGCPFAFYLRDVLGLYPPEELGATAEMEAGEIGTLVHGILEDVYREADAAHSGREGALATLPVAAARRFVEAERSGVTGAPVAWHAVQRQVLEDITHTIAGDDCWRSGALEPWRFEWRFGVDVGAAVELALDDGGSLGMRGRGDRLDRSADGRHVRVIDYKTGSGETERKQLRAGRNVQLPVYRLAVRQALGVDPESVACEYRMVRRRGGFVSLPLTEDEESSLATLRVVVALILTAARGGVFARAALSGCEYCDYSYACGSTAWSRQRKRDDAALAAVIALQTADLREAEGGPAPE
jgi:ATP-dependent helicase/nuclease subunit B